MLYITRKELPCGSDEMSLILQAEGQVSFLRSIPLSADPSSDGDPILALLHAKCLEHIHKAIWKRSAGHGPSQPHSKVK